MAGWKTLLTERQAVELSGILKTKLNPLRKKRVFYLNESDVYFLVSNSVLATLITK